MRNTDDLDPMWEASRGDKAAGPALKLVAGLTRRLVPHLHRFVAAQRPEVRMSWGIDQYRVGRDGLKKQRRVGPGWEDNPRNNYNVAVERRLKKAGDAAGIDGQGDEAAVAALTAQASASDPSPEAKAPADDPRDPATPDLSLAALEAAVSEKMGTDLEAEEAPRDPDALKGRIDAMRALLADLDDVGDWDLLESVDNELYQLHKAVDYKLRSHKSSEAKAKLNAMFKD